MISPHKYLEGEDLAKQRHEYVDGIPFPMPDPNIRHGMVRNNIMFPLHKLAREKGFQLNGVSLKVRLQTANTCRFYYPDIVITKEEGDPDSVYLTDPSIIIEIVGDNTERTDLFEKIPSYQIFPNVTDIVAIHSDSREIQHFRRSQNWQPRFLNELDDVLELTQLDFQISHSKIYEEIKFPPKPAQPWFHPLYP